MGKMRWWRTRSGRPPSRGPDSASGRSSPIYSNQDGSSDQIWRQPGLARAALNRRLRMRTSTSFRTSTTNCWRARNCAVRCCRSATTAAERCPCFSGAMRQRSRPFGVHAPVDFPPCMRHFPLAMAGVRHIVPARVCAPQRGASDRSPGGLPFFSQPCRRAWGASYIFVLPPTPSAYLGRGPSMGQRPPPGHQR